jgi:hypothetical protein
MAKKGGQKRQFPVSDEPTRAFLSASPLTIREEFERLVVGDIHGPAFGEHETIPAHPVVRDRYLVGMLAPRDVRVVPERVDDAGSADDESKGDVSESERIAAVGLAPSSIGLSFSVDGSVAELEVHAEWGYYKKESKQRDDVEQLAGFWISQNDRKKDKIPVWQRYSRSGSIRVPLVEGDLRPLPPVKEVPAVVICGRARRHNNAWLVTLFLVNEQLQAKENKDQAWLFQTRLSVAAGGQPVFIDRTAVVEASSKANDDGEAAQLDMLYRSEIEFAIGYGTAVHAEVAPGDLTRATRLTTQNVPCYEVGRTEQPIPQDIPLLGGMELDMKILSEMPDADFQRALMPVVTAYRSWIDDQERRISEPSQRLSGHVVAAHESIRTAREIADRVKAGIDLLATDPTAAEAFRFANEAMWRQRIQQKAIEHRERIASDQGNVPSLSDAVKVVDRAENRSWRLFQVAFICLNVPSLTLMKHADRVGDTALVDLLFFPTGGGKTEAYLGLVAFTFAIRRLQGKIRSDDGDLDGSEGVAVLMRYTLRLLTAQQFQRAAALVCACEYARRERLKNDARWGDTPFRLGLWIGASTTPNWSSDARQAVETARDRDGYTGIHANPLQITKCPWCGSALDVGKHVRTDDHRWRTLTLCSEPYGTCPFTDARAPGEGIPVVTVDEEIYRLLPAFVIATVDKFAQLPWRGSLHLLFGRTYQRCSRHGFRSFDLDKTSGHEEHDKHRAVNGLPEASSTPCDRLRPPDLIIQDELHLISGPLGTLVGLYETAIDRLASMTIDGTDVRPKVVASTATIRRASHQANALFERRLSVFPPPILDAGDSFFAVQKPVSPSFPGRRYVGVCARGVRLKAAEARLTVSLLAAAQVLFDKYGPLADPYMTMVGYFSSLRELAGMRRLVDDDVRERLPKAERRALGKRPRPIVLGELTSRMRSDDIPRVLERLGLPHIPDQKKNVSVGPFDIVLATNMISVGVDVPRLGLMLTVGQPKSTAEYIQATSRVGRELDKPGIVFTLYNWARPRDLSHYERFEHDHATFYQQVEALSVTPFSERALDRGLTAVVVGLIRHESAHRALGATTNPELAAQVVPLIDAALREMLKTISRRVARIEPDPDLPAEIERKVAQRLDQWLDIQRAAQQSAAPISYTGRSAKTPALILEPQPYRWGTWVAPYSLRETEHTINLLLNVDDSSTYGAPEFGRYSGPSAQDNLPGFDDPDENEEGTAAPT